jgi:hypothetical protein
MTVLSGVLSAQSDQLIQRVLIAENSHNASTGGALNKPHHRCGFRDVLLALKHRTATFHTMGFSHASQCLAPPSFQIRQAVPKRVVLELDKARTAA